MKYGLPLVEIKRREQLTLWKSEGVLSTLGYPNSTWDINQGCNQH